MNSLFRIDRNSIHNGNIDSAGVVMIPGFHELTVEKQETKEVLPVSPEGEPDQLDIKQEELCRLQKQIEEAEETAKRIIAEAESAAEETRERAAREGYEEGRRQACDEFDKEIEEERKEVGRLKKELACAKGEMFVQMESGVLDLSMCIAEKIVKETLNRNDEVFLNIVRDMLSMVKEQSNILLKVNKKEYDRFFADEAEEFTALLKSSGILIKQDLSVEAGECMLETDLGTVCSGIRMQLKHIADALCEADEA